MRWAGVRGTVRLTMNTAPGRKSKEERDADTAREGTAKQRVADLLSQMSSLGLVGVCVIGFVIPAIVGLSMISRLGGAGWFMYAFVLGTWGLVFGPIVASAVTMHQNGSRRHREAKRQRIEEQRRKFGLHVRTHDGERARRAAAPGTRGPVGARSVALTGPAIARRQSNSTTGLTTDPLCAASKASLISENGNVLISLSKGNSPLT